MRAIANTRWGNGRHIAAVALAAMTFPLEIERAFAGPGDAEIRIGNTMPYTRPASAYGVIGKVLAAYFEKVNAEGGINGRRIKFISYDDGYNPTKTVEATRKLVEEDNVHFVFASLGTNTSAAVQPYLNSKKIPQLFVASGASMWDQPREFPWSMGFLPSYQSESTSMRNTCWRTIRRAGLPCSTRMTASARIILRA